MSRAAALIIVLLVASGTGAAQNRTLSENVTHGYAQVLRASPVYETVRTRTPEQRCEVPGSRSGGDPTAGTVVGAVVGGALGNQAGKGDGRRASTLAGVVIGGAIGRRIDRGNGSGAGSRCRSVDVERTKRRIAGYDVEYQYKGEKYMSRLDRDPGNRLRVRVSITPVEASAGEP